MSGAQAKSCNKEMASAAAPAQSFMAGVDPKMGCAALTFC